MLRREIPTLIGFFFGMMMIANYFVPWRPLGYFAGDVQQWALIVVAFAYVLGGLNIFGIHVQKIARRGRDWQYSAMTVLALATALVLGFMPENQSPQGYLSFLPKDFHGGKAPGTPLLWLYNATYAPLGATVFSLLAFYIASASFRAFRIRNWQAAALAVTALLVMLSAVPLTTATADWLIPGAGVQITQIRSWVMEALQNAGKRSILIGVALGSIATGIKIILGIERPYGRD